MNHWLFKSEPDTFSFDHLKSCPHRREPWNGVRNYQARNFIAAMKPGDLGFFYHSSCPQPGIAGVVRVVSEAQPDPAQFDPASEYYDSKSKPENPRWLLVEVAWEADLPRFVPLSELRAAPELAEMSVLRKGSRLSITPVTAEEFLHVQRMGRL